MDSNFKSVKYWQRALKRLGLCSLLGIAMLGPACAAGEKKSSPSASASKTSTVTKSTTTIAKKTDTTKRPAILKIVVVDDLEADGGGDDLDELMNDQQEKNHLPFLMRRSARLRNWPITNLPLVHPHKSG